MAYIRKVKTSSGATAVQVCWKEGGKLVRMEHLGSTKSAAKLKNLLKKAQGIVDEGKNPLFDLSHYDKV